MSCPKCGSDEWKSASFMFKAGLTDIDTDTTSIGVGVGGGTGGVGAGIGVSGSSTDGTHQTKLSTESSPPEKPANNQGTIYWVAAVILSIMVSGQSEFVGGLIFVAAIYFWFSSFQDQIKKDYEQRVKEYNSDLAKWEKTKICQRCGEAYV